MKIQEMTRKDFEALPQLEKWEEAEPEIIGSFDSLVILPCEKLVCQFKTFHDASNEYNLVFQPKVKHRCMDFVAVRDNEPVCRISNHYEELCFDGTAGGGYEWRNKTGRPPSLIPPSGWCVDCLPESGLLHVFSSIKRRLTFHKTGKCFELFVFSRKKKEVNGG